MDVVTGQFCIHFVLVVSPALALVYSFLDTLILSDIQPLLCSVFMLVLVKDGFTVWSRIAFSSAACSQTCTAREKRCSFIQLREQKHCLPSSRCIFRVMEVSPVLQGSSLLSIAEQALGTLHLFCYNRNVMLASACKYHPRDCWHLPQGFCVPAGCFRAALRKTQRGPADPRVMQIYSMAGRNDFRFMKGWLGVSSIWRERVVHRFVMRILCQWVHQFSLYYPL